MNIVEVIQNYGVDLVKNGELYLGLCPFHNDRNTPNMYVYPKTDSFYCYACLKGGDIIQFMALIEHKDRSEIQAKYVEDNIKSKLRILREGSHNSIDFKKEVILLTSNICRDFIHKNRDTVSHVLQILKVLDVRLKTLDTIDYKYGMQIVEKFKKYLDEIRRKKDENHQEVCA